MNPPPAVLIIYRSPFGIVVQVGDVKVTAPTIKAALAVLDLWVEETEEGVSSEPSEPD